MQPSGGVAVNIQPLTIEVPDSIIDAIVAAAAARTIALLGT